MEKQVTPWVDGMPGFTQDDVLLEKINPYCGENKGNLPRVTRGTLLDDNAKLDHGYIP